MDQRSSAAATLSPGHRRVVLLTLCLAAFTINLDTTIVNVTLPTLVRDLNASTRQLQWIVDSYNLVFAAFVLAAGSVSDRFGPRGRSSRGWAFSPPAVSSAPARLRPAS